MKLKREAMSIVKKGALKCAKESATARCPFFCYQPKVPKSINKLKTK